jgi:hypothetical protein
MDMYQQYIITKLSNMQNYQILVIIIIQNII